MTERGVLVTLTVWWRASRRTPCSSTHEATPAVERTKSGGCSGVNVGEAIRSQHVSTIERISFVTDSVAIVDERAVVSHLAADNDPEARLEHCFIDILVRDGGRWLIAHIRADGLEQRT